ncbi:glutamyl-tRNA reductase [Kribbella flavida DSM 17836]|uniref:Glutamyl-tRNA reductase n=1 Tax=Kribbella flavida (strain DSM 17836 / JCM 10339 / NBRC 14399) TaxID=479435 RepID=D2PWZ6_KRIFD|nr:glutamyl-tRNA reductase [Kribbella flavida]ADB35376.1 glutamyl-tRNA reductase [Kribbella flavida DSM 17836]
MSYLVVGISHRSGDISVLERVALDPDAATKLAVAVQHSPAVSESAVLATCNRTEVYACVDRFHAGMDEVTAILSDITGVPLLDLAEHLYVHFEEGAVAHLFQVAGGLDSMVVGESQILGQLKETLRIGQDLETIGSALNALFQHALRTGKRARAETGIDSAGRSVVTAGLEAVGGFEGRRALIVGAGSMASLAAQTLLNGGAASVTIANRNHDRAVALTERIGGTAIPLAGVPDALAEADLVVSCTGARGVVLTEEMIRNAADGRPLGVLDVALPRDVEPGAARIPGVTLITLADLAGTAGGSAHDVDEVRRIVAEEGGAFEATRRAASVAPTVVALRAMASELVDSELARLDRRLPGLDEHQRHEVARTIRRVVDKVLHTPTVRVKELAADPGGPTYADALRELFALDPATVDAVTAPKTTTGGESA